MYIREAGVILSIDTMTTVAMVMASNTAAIATSVTVVCIILIIAAVLLFVFRWGIVSFYLKYYIVQGPDFQKILGRT